MSAKKHYIRSAKRAEAMTPEGNCLHVLKKSPR